MITNKDTLFDTDVLLRYVDFGFDSRIKVKPQENNVLISVTLDKPLPENLEGRAEYVEPKPIAGGVVPGVLVLKPDFPENKEDLPFLWGENEYVINICAEYIFLVNAVCILGK